MTLAAASVASLAGSVSGTKTSTSTLRQPDTDSGTDNQTTSKAGCYKCIPLFDPNYFCGWCNCEKMSSWHYQLIPVVSIVPTNYFANDDDDENDSNDEEAADEDLDLITQANLSTPFKNDVDVNAPTCTVPAVVTPPEKLASKIDLSPKIIAKASMLPHAERIILLPSNSTRPIQKRPPLEEQSQDP